MGFATAEMLLKEGVRGHGSVRSPRHPRQRRWDHGADGPFHTLTKTFLKEKRPTLELQRRGEAEEVAAMITFLCSERGSFINGTNIRIDGGSVATV